MPLRAVIDVGTNSVKILLAEVTGHSVTPLWETSEQTRLGRGFYETLRLQPEPIAATAAAIAGYASEARARGAVSVRVIATSAARDAVNRDELLEAIRQSSGLRTEVISGELEAEWGFRGVMTDPAYAGRPILIIDVGGGSTEFILGRTGSLDYRQSFKLGSVRLHERFPPADPPGPGELGRLREWLDGFLRDDVEPGLTSAMQRAGRPERVVGVGGTTAILALMEARVVKFDRELVESARFEGARLGAILEGLWNEPLAVRRTRVGLPPERADVIPFGAAIYEAVLRVFGFPELGVSTRGLRYAALLGEPGHD
jgi:exopolyphosphatase/guanosine-5'-triphosphate,3'-diphosphate pyrophosphatase